MIWVGRKILEFCCDFLILIPDFTDYDYLQQIETNTLDAINEYMSSSNKEIFKRNRTIKATFSQLLQQTRDEKNEKVIEELKQKIRELEDENKEIKNFKKELQEIFDQLQEQISFKKKELFKGLLPERIQQFEQFQADESFVGDQCAICMEDFEIGRNMMRLDCDGQHTFCQVCIEGWFAEHNTCPICRHIFE